MYNAPMHKPTAVREFIEEGDHKYVHLPLYLPFLNPIKKFWSKVKYGVKK